MTDKRLKNKMVDELFDAILTLKNREDYYRLFEDLCTVGEMHSLAQCLSVAKMLDQGFKYDDIVKETGASTATISRVKRFLDYGADGYRQAIDRINKKKPRK